MTQIRTAEEMISEAITKWRRDISDRRTPEDLHKDLMIEYAKQFIDMAAEHGRWKIDKESILKIKDLIK